MFTDGRRIDPDLFIDTIRRIDRMEMRIRELEAVESNQFNLNITTQRTALQRLGEAIREARRRISRLEAADPTTPGGISTRGIPGRNLRVLTEVDGAGFQPDAVYIGRGLDVENIDAEGFTLLGPGDPLAQPYHMAGGFERERPITDRFAEYEFGSPYIYEFRRTFDAGFWPREISWGCSFCGLQGNPITEIVCKCGNDRINASLKVEWAEPIGGWK